MKYMKRFLITSIILLLVLAGCSDNEYAGSEQDFEFANQAIVEKLKEKPAVINSDLTMNFGLGDNKFTATSRVLINILEDGTAVMKLPQGIDFGAIPVGQLGLENLNREMIYLIKDNQGYLFVEGELTDSDKVNVDLEALYKAVTERSTYEEMEGRLKNFVVVKNGDEVTYTYEIITPNPKEEMNAMIDSEEISGLEDDDISILMTQSIHLSNKEVVKMTNTETIMINAGALIGPEAGNIGKMTIDMFIESDFRESDLIDIPDIELEANDL